MFWGCRTLLAWSGLVHASEGRCGSDFNCASSTPPDTSLLPPRFVVNRSTSQKQPPHLNFCQHLSSDLFQNPSLLPRPWALTALTSSRWANNRTANNNKSRRKHHRPGAVGLEHISTRSCRPLLTRRIKFPTGKSWVGAHTSCHLKRPCSDTFILQTPCTTSSGTGGSRWLPRSSTFLATWLYKLLRNPYQLRPRTNRPYSPHISTEQPQVQQPTTPCVSWWETVSSLRSSPSPGRVTWRDTAASRLLSRHSARPGPSSAPCACTRSWPTTSSRVKNGPLATDLPVILPTRPSTSTSPSGWLSRSGGSERQKAYQTRMKSGAEEQSFGDIPLIHINGCMGSVLAVKQGLSVVKRSFAVEWA